MKNSIKPNILIVDDIEENLNLIEYLLDSLDVNLITAQSGAEALDKIQDTEIMLALIDVKMPEMNGFDLAELMQKNTSNGLIPVILVTAYTGDQDDIENYYRAGVIDYISKPFRKHVLLSKVKVFMKLYRQKLQIRNQKAEIELKVKELRESEKMYRTLLSAAPQGIVILNLKRLITELSDITIEVFGADSINDFIGKDFFSIIPLGGKEKLKTILSQTLSDGLVQNEEVILEKKNKSPFVSEISATLIQEDDGAPKAYMIIIHDISQRKILEQQLIRSERMVSLGEMASGMAHEINQPLLSIQFGIENLLNKIQPTNTADKNYLKKKSGKIFEDIVRIDQIINHIRDFSKEKEYIYSTFDINNSISNAISIISQQFINHGIKLTFEPGKEVFLINGNTYRFEQVIINMLSNAKDAVEGKTKMLKTDFDKNVIIRSYDDNDSIYVEVKDNGTGIDPDGTDRVLLPFYTTKEQGKGTGHGLGLAISFIIVKELDGIIKIESRKGVGSTFIIKLPKPKM